MVRCTALGFPRFRLRTDEDGSRFRDAEHVRASCAALPTLASRSSRASPAGQPLRPAPAARGHPPEGTVRGQHGPCHERPRLRPGPRDPARGGPAEVRPGPRAPPGTAAQLAAGYPAGVAGYHPGIPAAALRPHGRDADPSCDVHRAVALATDPARHARLQAATRNDAACLAEIAAVHDNVRRSGTEDLSSLTALAVTGDLVARHNEVLHLDVPAVHGRLGRTRFRDRAGAQRLPPAEPRHRPGDTRPCRGRVG